MTSDYRKELIKAGVVNYWNRNSVSKNIGLYNCLRQIDNKLDLKLEEKSQVHAIYFNCLKSFPGAIDQSTVAKQSSGRTQGFCGTYANMTLKRTKSCELLSIFLYPRQ